MWLIKLALFYFFISAKSWQFRQRQANSVSELVITNMEHDENFNLPFKVKKWKGLSFGSFFYNVGLMETGFVVVQFTLNSTKNGFVTYTIYTEVKKQPSDLVLFNNRVNATSQLIVIISYVDDTIVDWFKIKQTTSQKFWSFSLDRPVIHMNLFKIKLKNILLMSQFESGGTSILLYEFNLRASRPKYRFIDVLEVQEAVRSSAFNTFNGNHYISLPQTNLSSVYIFKYTKGRFKFFKTLHSEAVKNIASFRIALKSYLAIDGMNAGINEFLDDRIVSRDIVNSHSEDIVYWLPIPVETNREDVVLLAQRLLDHQSHNSLAVELIVNNGGKFEEHMDIPCVYHSQHSNSLQLSSIIGASYIAIEDVVAVLIPREQTGNSDLFYINYTISEIQDPAEVEVDALKKYKEEIQGHIEKVIEQQESLTKKNHEELERWTEGRVTAMLRSSSFDTLSDVGKEVESLGLRIKELKEKIRFENNFNTVTVNGNTEFNGDVATDEVQVETINNVNATSLLTDIVRKSNITNAMGSKTFLNLTVENLTVEIVNGIEITKLKNESMLTLTGNVTFVKPVTAENVTTEDGKINDIDLDRLIHFQDPYTGNLTFENVTISNFQVDEINRKKINKTPFKSDLNVTIAENIFVEYINGENFSKFVGELCLTNLKCHIPGNVSVIGNITTEALDTQHLNDLKFPQEYILKDPIPHANITGWKKFKILTAREIRSEGTISGINTDELFTLSTEQEVTGRLMFENLEVTENFTVNGKVIGKSAEKFFNENSSLKEGTTVIRANVNFKDLTVDGKVIVNDKFNGQNLEQLLKDIVYKDEDEVEITAMKEFPQGVDIKDNLEIESNSINSNKLEELITKNSPQKLSLNLLKGDVQIKNLYVKDSFDGRNITNLDENLVKLTGEQFISSNLIFNDVLTANKFEIMSNLNGLTVDEYVQTNVENTIKFPINFNRITADEVLIDGDLNGEISGLNLMEIEKFLSYTKNQTINAPYEIKRSEIDQLKATFINDIKFNDLFNENWFVHQVKAMLNNGSIEELMVKDDLTVDKINSNSFSRLFHIDPFENGTVTNLTVRGNIYCGAISLETFNTLNWNEFINQAVFKNDSEVIFEGPKTFLGGFRVKKLIETRKLNKILLKNIFRNVGNQKIKSAITINGNVTFENVDVIRVNRVSVRNVLDKLKMVNGSYLVNGDVIFTRLPYIQNFRVHGKINGENLKEFLSEIAYIDKDIIINATTTFKSSVGINKHLNVINKINNMHSNEISDIARIERDEEISGPITFAGNVSIFEVLKVDNDLHTKTLFNIDTEDWLNNGIILNRGLLYGNYTFENITVNNNLVTQYINEHNMKTLIPLKTNQRINYLKFNELSLANDIFVGNLINGYELNEEILNTVMSDAVQTINTGVIFKNNVLINDNFTVKIINNKNSSEILTTNLDNRTVKARLNFIEKCTFNSDVNVHGSINGINLTEWNDDCLKTFSNTTQNVTRKFTVLGNLTFKSDVSGAGAIEDFNVKFVADRIEEKRDYKYKHQKGLIQDYNDICMDIKHLYGNSKKQIYKFKYLDYFQDLTFHNDVHNIFFIEHDDFQYLLVNEYNCKSHLYTFNNNKFEISTTNINTGNILQLIKVTDKNTLYLVIKSDKNEPKCNITGTNVWQINPQQNLFELKLKMEDHDLLQDSLIPNKFYALKTNKEAIEYNLNSKSLKEYRKWYLKVSNKTSFIPRGLNTGLALLTFKKIVLLNRNDDMENDNFENALETIVDTVEEVENDILESKYAKISLINAGVDEFKKSLLGVTFSKPYDADKKINHEIDVIKIYEDVMNEKLFCQINTYDPSSLVSLELNQGETLLFFMENGTILHVYEYKGIEKFKYKTSLNIPASKIIPMSLNAPDEINSKKVLGLIHKNKIRMLEAVMVGNKIEKEMECEL